MKPKVLHIVNRLSIGGLVPIVAQLCAGMSERYESLLVAGPSLASEGDGRYIALQLGIEVLQIEEMHRPIRPRSDRRAYRRLRELMRDWQPDIVHTHGAKAGALGRLAAHHERVPVILHTYHGHVFHSYFGRAKTWVYKAIERRLAQISSQLIALSPSQKIELSREYRIAPADKISIIPLGFDLSRFQVDQESKRQGFRQKHHIPEECCCIGIIGRLVPIKNHQLFLNSLHLLAQKTDSPFKVFIIGDGELRLALEQQASDSMMRISTPENPNPHAQIIFTSWIQNVDSVVHGLDIIALSSLNEGTPVSLLEASAALKPIVATAVGGVEDLLGESQNALLVPSGEEVLFAEALQKLVENQQLRKLLGKNGRAVANRFSLQKMIERTETLYQELQKSSRP